VDWIAASLTIERSVAVVGRKEIIIEGTKTHAIRRLALDDFGVEVAGRLGHKDACTTLRVYSHGLPERDRDAAGLLGRALSD